jgi:hemerythrin
MEEQRKRDLESMSTEHRLQIEVLDALLAAVEAGRRDTQVGELLARLSDLSAAHFLSEDLLMRLHAYPDHAAHVAEHEEMTEMLAALRAEEGGPSSNRLAALRNRFVHHIHARDEQLEDFLDKPGRNDDMGSPDV